MIKSTAYLSVLSALLILFTAMTCNDTVIQTPDQECIDRSKIDPNRGCPRNYEPVCGCNGVTYSNSCEAEKAGVTSFTKGECPCVMESLKKPNAPCTKEYRPVCGCDGKTYGNECEAKKAGVTKWEAGKCKDQPSDTGCIDRSKIDPNRGCPRNYDPVCACNGITYSNSCEAEKAGVTNWFKGDCKDCFDPQKINKKDCPADYDPVCGCDNKTYSNACKAENAGLKKWTPGECPKPCIDPAKIDPNKPCTKEYRPVCGCDGKTYSNKCMAEKAGVTRWTDGKCN